MSWSFIPLLLDYTTPDVFVGFLPSTICPHLWTKFSFPPYLVFVFYLVSLAHVPCLLWAPAFELSSHIDTISLELQLAAQFFKEDILHSWCSESASVSRMSRPPSWSWQAIAVARDTGTISSIFPCLGMHHKVLYDFCQMTCRPTSWALLSLSDTSPHFLWLPRHCHWKALTPSQTQLF